MEKPSDKSSKVKDFKSVSKKGDNEQGKISVRGKDTAEAPAEEKASGGEGVDSNVVRKPPADTAKDVAPKEPIEKQQQQQLRESGRVPAGLQPTTGDEPLGEEEAAIDFTTLPQELEAKFEALDEDGTLRPTIINFGETWTRRRQKALLAEAVETPLVVEDQERERNRAYDLLDALTKSGELVLEEADLHVIVAATHCFDKTLMNVVIQGNVNPIEKVERSSLIIATSVHGQEAQDLVQPEQLERLALYSPRLLPPAAMKENVERLPSSTRVQEVSGKEEKEKESRRTEKKQEKEKESVTQASAL